MTVGAEGETQGEFEGRGASRGAQSAANYEVALIRFRYCIGERPTALPNTLLK